MPLYVKSLKVGQLSSNCHLIFDRDSKECLIIDPGDDAGYITRVISDENLNPKHILATHGHFDHLMAAFELRLAYSIPFAIHPKDEFLVKKMRSSARFFTGNESGPPPKIDFYLKEGMELQLAGSVFEVLETPGHTPGAVSFHCRQESVVAVGDLIFAQGGVGRTDFSYSSRSKLKDSIKRILSLPEDTMILTGHGPETKVKDERKFHDL